MTDYQQEFISFMMDCGVLTFGDFTTKSGRKTPYFVNTGNYKTGAQAARLGDCYAACIQQNMPDGIDCLFGPAYKGGQGPRRGRLPGGVQASGRGPYRHH